MQQIKEEEFSRQFDWELWKKLGKYLLPIKEIVIILRGFCWGLTISVRRKSLVL